MITKGFRHKFIVKYAAALYAGFIITISILYLLLPSPPAENYSMAYKSFLEADASLFKVLGIGFIINSLILTGIVVVLAVRASHKIAGPIHRLQIFLKDMVTVRTSRTIRFRDDDQLHETAEAFNTMLLNLDARFRELDEAFSRMEETIKQSADEPEVIGKIKVKADELGASLNLFKV